MSIYLTDAVPHQAALDFLTGKIVLGRDLFYNLLPQFRAKAITISGLENIYAVQHVRDLLASVPGGADWMETKQSIADILTPYMSKDSMPEMEFLGFMPPDEEARKKAEARAELLLRTHVNQAYAVTYTASLDRHQDIFPYRQYLTMHDDKVRPEHADLDNLILPSNHPFWLTHTPPWDWNCRCSFAGLTAGEAGEIAQTEEENNTPEEQRLMPDETTLDMLANQEKLQRGNNVLDLRTPYEKDGAKGYEFHARSVSSSRETLLEGVDPDLRQSFKEWAQGVNIEELGISVWEWIGSRLPNELENA